MSEPSDVDFNQPIQCETPSIAIAIIMGYNEQDVVVATIESAKRQGMHVFYVDDHSTDSTRRLITKHYLGDETVGFAMLPQAYRANSDSAGSWDLCKQLSYKTHLSRTVFQNYRWLLHMDCDEVYECRWADSVAQGLAEVPNEYGIVNCTVYDYYPCVDDPYEWRLLPDCTAMFDIRNVLKHRRTRRNNHRYYRFLRNTAMLRLGDGHGGTTTPRSVYSKTMEMHHFPYRSATLARNKISTDRLPRISAIDKKQNKGCHYQKDNHTLPLPIATAANKTIANKPKEWNKHCTWYIKVPPPPMPIFVKLKADEDSLHVREHLRDLLIRAHETAAIDVHFIDVLASDEQIGASLQTEHPAASVYVIADGSAVLDLATGESNVKLYPLLLANHILQHERTSEANKNAPVMLVPKATLDDHVALEEKSIEWIDGAQTYCAVDKRASSAMYVFRRGQDRSESAGRILCAAVF